MKYFNLLILAAFGIILTSCSSQMISLANGRQIDSRLTGIWTGSEKDQQIEGAEKSWEMTRNSDGTFILDFNYKQDGETQNFVEKGNWWIEDGKFYEFHQGSEKTDVYKYKVIDKNHIKFIAESISIDMNTDHYEFIDTRKNGSQKDGLSYENAVKVNSVREEYQFVKENCSGCELVSQALTENKGKMYDVLTVTKPNGSTVNYYFDIKSFFGKF